MTAPYRILSLDGGGIRGLLTAILIERLEKEMPGFLSQVDFFCGASTGGILALGFAFGIPPKHLRNLYEQKGPQIFSNSLIHRIFYLKKLLGADYSNQFLEKELQQFFGETKLKDLSKKVLIPSFDLDNQEKDPKNRFAKPKFYHNFAGDEVDREALLWKIGLYTSAAPTYFPSVEGYIDGGLVAMNPSVAALAQSQDIRKQAEPPGLQDIVMLSVSTGKSLFFIKGKTLDWGFAQWAKPSLRVWLDGITDISDYQCKQFLREKYCRIDPAYPPSENVEMDAVDKIPLIISTAKSVDLTPTLQWLQKNWMV
jgi:patatin-like phospholipase/acyl hydrolase